MAKKTDDDILLEGFSIIRQGILDEDIDEIRRGYELVSGETLEKPKSKLEKLRDGLSNKQGKTSYRKKKEDKLDLSPLDKRAQKGGKRYDLKVVEKLVGTKDKDAGSITAYTQPGGKKFASEGLVVITTELDPEIQSINEEIHNKTNKKARDATENILESKPSDFNVDFTNKRRY